MELNNRQLVDKYVADKSPPQLLPPQYGAVSTDLINVYFQLFIYFIVEHNVPKSVGIFAWKYIEALESLL